MRHFFKLHVPPDQEYRARGNGRRRFLTMAQRADTLLERRIAPQIFSASTIWAAVLQISRVAHMPSPLLVGRDIFRAVFLFRRAMRVGRRPSFATVVADASYQSARFAWCR